MTVRLAVVYRPPPSKDNCSTIPDFLDQWSTFLAGYTTHNNEIIIVGDLNFHVDVKNDRDAQRFMDTIKACGLQQHVHEPTHVLGHTLDVVISRDTSHIISDVTITDPGLCDHLGKLTRDHFAVGFTITLVKPAHTQKIVSYRKLRAIDVEAFKHDIVVSSMLQTTQGNVDGLVTAFTNGLTSLIDKHAPLRTRTITERPDCPWYTDTLHEAKHLRRKLERRWKKNRLTVNHQIYRDQCIVVNKLLKQTRIAYYSEKITACAYDQKGIYICLVTADQHLFPRQGLPVN